MRPFDTLRAGRTGNPRNVMSSNNTQPPDLVTSLHEAAHATIARLLDILVIHAVVTGDNPHVRTRFQKTPDAASRLMIVDLAGAALEAYVGSGSNQAAATDVAKAMARALELRSSAEAARMLVAPARKGAQHGRRALGCDRTGCPRAARSRAARPRRDRRVHEGARMTNNAFAPAIQALEIELVPTFLRR